MKYKFILFAITCALTFAGCSSSGSSTSSGSSDSSTDTSAASVVSSAQVKALSKIKNVKTKHTSKNGASGFGAFSTAMLRSSIYAQNVPDCKEHSYNDGFTTGTQKSIDNCTSKNMDLNKFKNSSIVAFTPGEMLISKRTLEDNSTKHMIYYQDAASKTGGCETKTDAYCYQVYGTDPGFYKDEYYGTTIGKIGTFMFDAYNQNLLYAVTYMWEEVDATSRIDVTDPHAPKIPTNNTMITIGTKDEPCKLTVGMNAQADPCLYLLGLYNEETATYDLFIGEYEESDSNQRTNNEGNGGDPGGDPGGGNPGNPGDDVQEAVFDLFYYDNAEFNKSKSKNDYFKNTVKKLCPKSPTADNKEKFYMNKVGYFVLVLSTGGYNVTTLKSDYSKDGGETHNFIAVGEDGHDADYDLPKISLFKEGSTTELAVTGTDCNRIPPE
tara:strand:- start:3227 stop:4540 length:1314 start_codon:yes stop_codon:yes gene_type:complete